MYVWAETRSHDAMWRPWGHVTLCRWAWKSVPPMWRAVLYCTDNILNAAAGLPLVAHCWESAWQCRRHTFSVPASARSHMPQGSLAPELELEPALHSGRSRRQREADSPLPGRELLEKACAQQHRLRAAKNKREKQSVPQQFYFREL